MRIAIDVMGGDHAPDAILNGALDSLSLLNQSDQLILVGDEQIIQQTITEHGLADEKRIVIEPTTQVIGMDESPTAAIRDKQDSSIARWAWLGSSKCPPDRRADIIISAGNTGACVAGAQMRMRRLPGVQRPGIAVTMPTFHGPVVICDVGANIVPRPHHLHQYGYMACVYAKEVHGVENPRVAVLNIGGEEGKGTDLINQASKLMRSDPNINYIGFVEGRDLLNCVADVVITEGFTGNVVLKVTEGMASGLFKIIARTVMEEDPELAARFEPVVKKIYAKHDYHEYGGAPLLGARGICFICHGSSEARTIKAAIGKAISYSQHNVNRKIVEALAASADAMDGVNA